MLVPAGPCRCCCFLVPLKWSASIRTIIGNAGTTFSLHSARSLYVVEWNGGNFVMMSNKLLEKSWYRRLFFSVIVFAHWFPDIYSIFSVKCNKIKIVNRKKHPFFVSPSKFTNTHIFLTVCQLSSNYKAKSETSLKGLWIGSVSVSPIASCSVMSPENALKRENVSSPHVCPWAKRIATCFRDTPVYPQLEVSKRLEVKNMSPGINTGIFIRSQHEK